MKIEQANTVFKHKITGGSEYGWRCWPNARFMDYESEHAYGSVVFSTVDQTLYEATVCWRDDERGVPYRWLNPETQDAMFAESEERGVDKYIAWDPVKWVDLELWEDFATKAGDIFNGREPDSRISVPLDLSDDMLLRLALEAHNQDITLNELVGRLLQAEIDAHVTLNDLDDVEVARGVRDEFRELCLRPHQTENDDTSTSDVEHSQYWHDTDRNR